MLLQLEESQIQQQINVYVTLSKLDTTKWVIVREWKEQIFIVNESHLIAHHLSSPIISQQLRNILMKLIISSHLVRLINLI